MSEGQARLSARKAAACTAVERRRPELEALSLRIHATPEVAFAEHHAVSWLAEALERGGFTVARGTAGLETAFVASYRGGPGPTVAFLAEYDALPGVGHGCGHNLIGVSAAGAAMAVRDIWPDMPGAILVVGAPAEETGGGKAHLVEAGVFQDVAAALMVHPGVRTQVAPPLLAMQEIDAEYHGRSTHPSSKPEEAINALDALVLAYLGIAALRQHVRQDGRVHGVITQGGSVPNVIPDRAVGRFSVRARDDAYLDELVERVVGCFRAGAEATGARLTCTFPSKRYAAMRSNPTLAAAFGRNLAELGIALTPPDDGRRGGSSDMGNVSQVVPALHPTLAIAPLDTPSHSLAFAEYAASPAGHAGLIKAAKALCMTALDLLGTPTLVARARAEHDAQEAVLAGTRATPRGRSTRAEPIGRP